MSQTKTYITKTKLTFTDSSSEVIMLRVKNCISEIHAKVKTGDYFKKKYKNISKIEILEINEDSLNNMFNIFK